MTSGRSLVISQENIIKKGCSNGFAASFPSKNIALRKKFLMLTRIPELLLSPDMIQSLVSLPKLHIRNMNKIRLRLLENSK